MTSKLNKFSVIIPAHNEQDTIMRSVQSILSQTEQDFEIIIVLDNCTDDTEQIVNKFNNKKIRYIKTTRGSAAGSRNAGALLARGKYLLFHDADCVADICLLNNALKSFEDYDVDGIATRTSNVEPTTWIQRAVATQRKMLWENNETHIKKIDKDSDINVAVMKRMVFKKLNGFNEHIFYFEDTDLTQRFFKSGYNAIFDPGLIQYHIDPKHIMESLGQCKNIAKGMAIRLRNQTGLTNIEYYTLFFAFLGLFTLIPEVVMFILTYIKTKDLVGSFYFSIIWTIRSIAKLFYLIREFIYI